ncbi:MAG: hypothetical protein RL095_2314 [Verrucomicrobiota bacterium]
MYKPATFIFLTGTLAFGSLWFVERSKNAQAPVANLTGTPDADPATIRLKSDLVAARKKADDLSKQCEELAAELEKAKRSPATAAAAPKTKTSELAESRYNEVANSMKEMGKQRIEAEYARLFKKLNLSAEEQEKFVSQIMETQMLRMSSGMKIWQEKDETKRKEMKDKLDEELAAAEKDTEALLGSRYALLQDYRDKQGAYHSLDNLNAVLGEKSLPSLSDDKVEELASLISSTEKANPYSIDIEEKGGWRQLSDEDRETVRSEREARNDKIVEASGLPAEQKEILKEQLNDPRRGGRGGFGRGFFGGGPR